MPKRKTKQQRIDEEKAALRQRVLDIAVGAGLAYDDGYEISDEAVLQQPCLQSLSRFIFGIRDHLCGGIARYAYLVNNSCLPEYETLDGAVERLYLSGIRADGSHLLKGDQ